MRPGRNYDEFVGQVQPLARLPSQACKKEAARSPSSEKHAHCARHFDAAKTKDEETHHCQIIPKKRSQEKPDLSAQVTEHSDALRLEPKVFTFTNPRRIAVSLKRSAETSKKRKGAPYQSAMSMLNFNINRAGAGLSGKQKNVLERAKPELRKAFGRS